MHDSINSFNSYGYVGRHAVNSAGEMSRLRSRMGIRVSVSSSPSEFILISKIKKAIQKAIPQADERMRVTFDRLISKLEKLKVVDLQYLVDVLDTDSFDQMIATMRMKAKVIHRTAARWAAGSSAESPEEEIDLTALEDGLVI